MQEATLKITNPTGLHARPAAQFVQKAASFSCKVKLIGNNKTADGKSILAVMGMGLRTGSELTIITDGEDEQACLSALTELINSNFGEGPAE